MVALRARSFAAELRGWVVMVAAATLHAFSTELLVGSMTFSVLATMLCLGESFMQKFGANILRSLDSAAYFSAIFSLCCIPIVALTGNAAGDASSSPYLVNKMLLSGLCLGLCSGLGACAWGGSCLSSSVLGFGFGFGLERRQGKNKRESGRTERRSKSFRD